MFSRRWIAIHPADRINNHRFGQCDRTAGTVAGLSVHATSHRGFSNAPSRPPARTKRASSHKTAIAAKNHLKSESMITFIDAISPMDTSPANATTMIAVLQPVRKAVAATYMVKRPDAAM